MVCPATGGRRGGVGGPITGTTQEDWSPVAPRRAVCYIPGMEAVKGTRVLDPFRACAPARSLLARRAAMCRGSRAALAARCDTINCRILLLAAGREISRLRRGLLSAAEAAAMRRYEPLPPDPPAPAEPASAPGSRKPYAPDPVGKPAARLASCAPAPMVLRTVIEQALPTGTGGMVDTQG